jgi:glyoxylase-like metal-dependent hydrolase (beta-lactamase superfamily II)
MAVFQIPTGVTHRSAGVAYRGGSFRDKRDLTMTAVLVKHPKGDLLIDTGFGRQLPAHMQLMPFWFRAMTSFTQTGTAADQLDAAGYDRSKLRGIVLTHAHWDHTSGLCDFPGTPVLVSGTEHHFVTDGTWITEVARSCREARYEEYDYDSGPYLGYEKSHDVYGDGSVVIVPAPGHTPGSANVFLTLPGGKRFALVGDLVWQREGITQREERPWLIRTLADFDPPTVRTEILRMASLAARMPELVLVPAHDDRGFAEMPPLGK